MMIKSWWSDVRQVACFDQMDAHLHPENFVDKLVVKLHIDAPYFTFLAVDSWFEWWTNALYCRLLGHDIRDRSSAGPDSGNMDCECVRCGKYWDVPLY